MGCVFLGRALSHSTIVEKELPKSFLPQPSSPPLLWPRIQHLLNSPVSLTATAEPRRSLSQVVLGDQQSQDSGFVWGKSQSPLSPPHIVHVAT